MIGTGASPLVSFQRVVRTRDERHEYRPCGMGPANSVGQVAIDEFDDFNRRLSWEFSKEMLDCFARCHAHGGRHPLRCIDTGDRDSA